MKTIAQMIREGYGECRVCHKLLKPDKNGYPLRHGGHAHPCPGVRYQLLGFREARREEDETANEFNRGWPN